MTRAVLIALLLLTQTPNPDYVGPEDPEHEGQPRTCTNVPHREAVKHDCKCKKTSCDPNANMEDKSCYVYCRKPACKCFHKECETE